MNTNELRQLPSEELAQHTRKLRYDMFQLRFKGVTEPITNPGALRSMRKEVARAQTFLRQRELASTPAKKKLTRDSRRAASLRKQAPGS